MALTRSSLGRILRCDIGISKEMTHGSPSNNADGFTRPTMMYLYSTWGEMNEGQVLCVSDTNRQQQSKLHESY